jgi:MMP 1-O-methyltransferase
LDTLAIPHDLEDVLDEAWESASKVPGFLVENEARFLGMMAACTPGNGAIVEIGSFKGKSTVMLAKVSQHYGLGPIVSIDPHNFNSAELEEHRTSSDASTFPDFLKNVQAAGVAEFVDARRAFSGDVSPGWNTPLRLLWIDGDHTYQGAKRDFDGFSRHLVPQGVVAFHDALHAFPGPIRVFVEDVLRSSVFGPAGFVHSLAWSQFRPEDGALFKDQRASLERLAARLIPFVGDNSELHGLRKLMFKLTRSRIPRSLISPSEWVSLVSRSNAH